MPNQNKRKGKDFENNVAKIVDKYCNQLLYKNEVEQLRVKRSPFSGAAKDEIGDIDLGLYRQFLPDLVIECKKWNRLNFNNNIFTVLNTLHLLWHEYKNQHGNKDIVLVFATNYGKYYCISDLRFESIEYFTYKDLRVYDFDTFIKLYINNVKEQRKKASKKQKKDII